MRKKYEFYIGSIIKPFGKRIISDYPTMKAFEYTFLWFSVVKRIYFV